MDKFFLCMLSLLQVVYKGQISDSGKVFTLFSLTFTVLNIYNFAYY